ncbi:putative TNF receptor-associated factor 6-like [Homarus americanus]|uniref:Putative TNF receptor-associated factor 6-like n=1 Tax=Homarus americanus TaxID=6706 RepID=A0A8J5JBR9_HOMAM|nr:putative TNF receptor-associated factor 6-like [Homarus americanus]
MVRMWGERLYLRVFVAAVCAVVYCTAQHSAADSLESMFNQLVQNSGSEVQSLSYCRISTRDLISTAQSTANRVLQGVCNPRELNERFTTLEKQVVDQFNVLKTMVLNIEDQLRNQDKQIKKHHGKLRQAIRVIRGGSVGGATSNDYHPEDEPEAADYEDGDYNEEGESLILAGEGSYTWKKPAIRKAIAG